MFQNISTEGDINIRRLQSTNGGPSGFERDQMVKHHFLFGYIEIGDGVVIPTLPVDFCSNPQSLFAQLFAFDSVGV
jgi:hypothetical protein